MVALIPFIAAVVIDGEGAADSALLMAGMAAAGLLGLAIVTANRWLASTRGQTIGKWMVGTQVVTAEGRPASLLRIIARGFIEQLVVGLFSIIGVGWLTYVTIFRADRRAPHDHVCETWVVVRDAMEGREGLLTNAQPRVVSEAVALARPSLGRRLASGAAGWSAFAVISTLALLPVFVIDDRDAEWVAYGSVALLLVLGSAWRLANMHLAKGRGATLSRLLLGLAVVHADGRPINTGTHAARAMVEYLAGGSRSLVDVATDSHVVRVPPEGLEALLVEVVEASTTATAMHQPSSSSPSGSSLANQS